MKLLIAATDHYVDYERADAVEARKQYIEFVTEENVRTVRGGLENMRATLQSSTQSRKLQMRVYTIMTPPFMPVMIKHISGWTKR
jgi:hypothetical protein